MRQKTKYPAPKRIKVGRTLYVCDFDGKPIVGLSWDSGNGQYFYSSYRQEKDFQIGTTTRKDYSFGVHYQDAVFKFKQWIRDHRKINITIPTSETELRQNILSEHIPASEQEKINGLLATLSKDGQDIQTRLDNFDTSIDLKQLLALLQSFEPYVESTITTEKQYALHLLKQLLQDEELRIEAIRTLKLDDLLPREYEALPFKEILQFYHDSNDCSAQEKRKVKTAVEDFVSIVKRKNINDVTEDDLELFRDKILKSNYSDTYKTGRLNRVKTVLSYYLENKKMNNEKELVRSVLTLCREILKTSTAKPDDKPKSIDNETVKKILQKAKNDNELLLMLLLMLNTGFTPVDIRTLKKSMIRTMNGITYIVHRRTKTDEQYIRVNCLWDITVKLLKKQFDKYPHTEYVFITKAGGKYTSSSIDKRFRTFFQELKKDCNAPLTAKHFKDTVASNLAFDVTNVNIIKITLGHSIKGTKDEFWKYVEDRPEQQKPAIDILYMKFKDAIEGIKT